MCQDPNKVYNEAMQLTIELAEKHNELAMRMAELHDEDILCTAMGFLIGDACDQIGMRVVRLNQALDLYAMLHGAEATPETRRMADAHREAAVLKSWKFDQDRM